MSDDDDHEIGGKIVGAVVAENLSAFGTGIVGFQEGAKQFALAAGRAAAAPAAHHRSPDIAFGRSGRRRSPWERRLRHGCGRLHRCAVHHLPRLPLPDLALPLGLSLRIFPFGLRPAFDAAPCFMPGRPRLPNSRLPRGVFVPSERSSNRSAPATGAASTRRTSTTSPSLCMAPLRVPINACRASSKL